jgi:hypothetical protein
VQSRLRRHGRASPVFEALLDRECAAAEPVGEAEGEVEGVLRARGVGRFEAERDMRAVFGPSIDLCPRQVPGEAVLLIEYERPPTSYRSPGSLPVMGKRMGTPPRTFFARSASVSSSRKRTGMLPTANCVTMPAREGARTAVAPDASSVRSVVSSSSPVADTLGMAR